MSKEQMNGSGRLSDAAEKRLQDLMARYPKPKSVVMPALYIAQEHFGMVTDEAVSWVASRLSIAPAHVREVATFYTMYYRRPVGRYHIQICRTLSCAICGASDLVHHLEKRFGVEAGEVTADGMWSFEEVECLGSCGTAPLAQINDVFFEKLAPEKLDAILDRIKKELPDLRYSTTTGELGTGMADHSRSQVWKAGS